MFLNIICASLNIAFICFSGYKVLVKKWNRESNEIQQDNTGLKFAKTGTKLPKKTWQSCNAL